MTKDHIIPEHLEAYRMIRDASHQLNRVTESWYTSKQLPKPESLKAREKVSEAFLACIVAMDELREDV